MENNEQLKLESGMPNLYELRTRLKNDLKSLEASIPQFDALVDIITKSGRESELPENFVEGVIKDKEHNIAAINTMKDRITYLNILIDMFEKQDEEANKVNQVIALLFAALFKQPSNNQASE